jgi:hypothetical protein
MVAPFSGTLFESALSFAIVTLICSVFGIRIWGHAVAYLFEVLCYKPEGRGFESLWGKGKGRRARKAESLTAICEPIVWKMWEPRPITPLWAFTACYRDSFTFFIDYSICIIRICRTAFETYFYIAATLLQGYRWRWEVNSTTCHVSDNSFPVPNSESEASGAGKWATWRENFTAHRIPVDTLQRNTRASWRHLW